MAHLLLPVVALWVAYEDDEEEVADDEDVDDEEELGVLTSSTQA
jgi:hypothetical protein